MEEVAKTRAHFFSFETEDTESSVFLLLPFLSPHSINSVLSSKCGECAHLRFIIVIVTRFRQYLFWRMNL